MNLEISSLRLLVARKLNLNSEDLLHGATDKFSRRFREVERRAGGDKMKERPLEELDALWNQVKKEEKSSLS